MNIPNSKKSRSRIKGFFVQNAIPTESNFADLIEAGINQRDDGLVKTQGQALNVVAGGDQQSQKPVLALFSKADDAQASCVFRLRPSGQNANGDAASGIGLGIGNAAGKTSLFLDPETGRIGIGTVAPQAALDVIGDVNIKGSLYITGTIKQENWQAPTLLNNWKLYGSSYNKVGYFKDSCGVVHLRGMVKGGPQHKAIFQLPEGYQPPRRELHIACRGPNDTVGRIDILADGQVIPVTSHSDWISLDGITFRAGKEFRRRPPFRGGPVVIDPIIRGGISIQPQPINPRVIR